MGGDGINKFHHSRLWILPYLSRKYFRVWHSAEPRAIQENTFSRDMAVSTVYCDETSTYIASMEELSVKMKPSFGDIILNVHTA